MSFWFSNSKKEKNIIVFDIGSGSVGGAIVKLSPDGNSVPTIIKSVRHDINFQNELDFDLFLNDMLKALNKTADELYKSKIGSPSGIYCVLASPWYISETRTIKMSKESSFVFTSKIADSLVEKEIQSLSEIYNKKYGGVNSLPEVIEHLTMGVTLNGYLVDEPLGIKSKSVEMKMIISLAPSICLDKIKKTLFKTFHTRNVSFSSFATSSFLAIRDKYINSDSYLMIDISGEITDISIVNNHILNTTISFPFGKKAFFKYICSKLNIEHRDAQELFNLYNSGIISDKFKDKLVPLFQSIENSWVESLEGCIKTIPSIISLPNNMFLTSDDDIRKWFFNVLSNNQYINSIVNSRKSNVITLDGPEFLPICNVKNGVCDPFLMIESIAINRKLGNK